MAKEKQARITEVDYENKTVKAESYDVQRIQLKYVQLHTPLFFGSKSFKEKIDSRISDVSLVHYVCGLRNELHARHNGVSVYLPFVGNVAVAIPFDDSEADIVIPETKRHLQANPIPNPHLAKAQVSAPAGIKI